MIEKDKLITLYAVIKLDNPETHFILDSGSFANKCCEDLNKISRETYGTNLWEVFVLQCRVEDMRRRVE